MVRVERGRSEKSQTVYCMCALCSASVGDGEPSSGSSGSGSGASVRHDRVQRGQHPRDQHSARNARNGPLARTRSAPAASRPGHSGGIGIGIIALTPASLPAHLAPVATHCISNAELTATSRPKCWSKWSNRPNAAYDLHGPYGTNRTNRAHAPVCANGRHAPTNTL